MGAALYGKEKPSPKLPAAISEHIENSVWAYLDFNQSAAETIHTNMAKHFCKVNLKEPNVCLRPDTSLLQQQDAKAIMKEWKETVKLAFAQSLSKFKSLKLKLVSEVWEDSEKTIRKMLHNEDVVMVPDKGNGVLLVAGHASDVNRLEQTLFEAVNKVAQRLHRVKSSVTQEVKVPQSVFHMLCQDGLEGKLLSVYPDLNMSYRKDNPDLIVTGLREEIIETKKIIYDEIFALKRQTLEIDTFVLDLLKNQQQEELSNALLKSHGIKAAFEINADTVQLLAVHDRDLKDAKDHLRRLLITESVDVADSKVLIMPEWKHLVSQLENANNKPYKRIRIGTSGQKVVVSGHKDDVLKVSRQLNDFLTQNAQVEEIVSVKYNAIVEYIQTTGKSWLEKVNDKVVVRYKKDAICLSGRQVDVSQYKTVVRDVVASVFFDNFKVSIPGAKVFFKGQEALYTQVLLRETGCLVQLAEATGGQGDVAVKAAPKPVYQIQTSDGVDVAVCKADLCRYPLHAVVSGATEDLKHNGGLARALVSAAGPQLQHECDKLISSKGPLKLGECVITSGAGQLCCKKVIFIAAPRYDPGNPSKTSAKLKRAVKESLELAEKHGCTSVAMPIISKNQGFPLDLCAVTIAKAVKEHCDEKYDDSTMKRIHFVDNDDSSVKAMEAAVRKQFGDNTAPISPQTSPISGPESTPANQNISDPNCLGQEQTKEGVNIILMKGNIENATVICSSIILLQLQAVLSVHCLQLNVVFY